MRYRLRTLLLLLAIGPPLIGLWPAITKRAILRATQITAIDVAVVGAAATMIVIRVRLYRSEREQLDSAREQRSTFDA
jgi:hypothetical protein